MKVPDWLNPWWHVDSVFRTSATPDAVVQMLTPRDGRLRGRVVGAGRLQLVRRSLFRSHYVRAEVDVRADDSLTVVTARIAWSRLTSGSFAVILAVVVGGVALQVIYMGFRNGPLAALGYAPFLLIAPVIWVFVIGANYMSSRGEARNLMRLIEQALGQPTEAERLEARRDATIH